MVALPQMYRSALRQFVKNSIHPRADRSPSIPQHLRLLFESGRAIKAASPEATRFERDVENMVVFLKSRRVHKELIERYNPVDGMTEAERIEATANRVGLSSPEEYDVANPRDLPEGHIEPDAAKASSDAKGSLQTMFAPQN